MRIVGTQKERLVMGFRIIVVNSRCKLECRLNYLVIRGETERKIFLNEINTLIVQSTAVSLTVALLCELNKNNVKVIFCDEKCNPQSELIPYYGAHNTSKRCKQQFAWSMSAKRIVWDKIVVRKIENQAELLLKTGFVDQSRMLSEYASQVTDGDVTNREGHAAKVYFNCILPQNTTRRSGGFVNKCLDYGYAILLSAFNREIVSCGYLTQLGLFHENEFNPFNFSCDLMEPLRPVVDELAISLPMNDQAFKKKMANVLNFSAKICGKNTTLDLAIRQYTRSVIAALEQNDVSLVCFPSDVAVENG